MLCLVQSLTSSGTGSSGTGSGGNGGSTAAAAAENRTLVDAATRQRRKLLVKARSTSSVSTLAYAGTATAANDQSMAPLQTHAEAQSLGELNVVTQRNVATAAAAATTTTIETKRHTYTPASTPTATAAATTTAAQSKQKRPFVQQLSVPTSSSNAQQPNSGGSGGNFSDNYYSSSGSVYNNNSNKSESKTLKHSASAVNTLAPPAAAATSTAASSSSSLRSNSPANRSKTAKHEQQSSSTAAAAATVATTAQAAAAAGGGTTALTVAQATPPEKEKKRKEVSSSRVKKFHRHFSQVSKDEKLINYFSCALVSDILLQGHLYITEQHFAFYSNVFGYVTKVVIPTSSVTKISKEKTAKIIPNAVGVATADERHVFGSFISREAAFRLMCSVCYTPCAPAEILPKVPADIEISEEYSIEDDSSCSISGNESPPQNAAVAGASGGAVTTAAGTAASGIQLGDGQTLLRRTVISSSLTLSSTDGQRLAQDSQQRLSDIPVNAKTVNSTASNALSSGHTQAGSNFSLGTTTTATATTIKPIIPTPTSVSSTPSSPSNSTSLSSATTTIMGGLRANPKTAAQAAFVSFKNFSRNLMLRFKFPTDLNVVYVGVLLSVLLALFSVFLLYRILNIEAKTSFYHTPADFNWRSGNDDEIFAEALRWHRELQAKSTEEAQTILNTNLEQIAKVRRSLETLSMLIHDRSSAFGGSANRDDSD